MSDTDTFNVERVIPIRNDHDVLVSIAQLLTENLAELKHVRAALTNGASRSSVEIKTSTRGADVTVKSYGPESPVIDAEQDALQSFLRLRAELEQRLMAGWQQTVDQGKAR